MVPDIAKCPLVGRVTQTGVHPAAMVPKHGHAVEIPGKCKKSFHDWVPFQEMLILTSQEFVLGISGELI